MSGQIVRSGLARTLATRGKQDSCTIVRPRVIDNGRGGTKPHPDGPARIGPLPCRFITRSGGEQQDGEVIEERGAYEIRLAPSAPGVLASDTIEVVGRVYQVVWTPPMDVMDVERTIGLNEAGRQEVTS